MRAERSTLTVPPFGMTLGAVVRPGAPRPSRHPRRAVVPSPQGTARRAPPARVRQTSPACLARAGAGCCACCAATPPGSPPPPPQARGACCAAARR